MSHAVKKSMDKAVTTAVSVTFGLISVLIVVAGIVSAASPAARNSYVIMDEMTENVRAVAGEDVIQYSGEKVKGTKVLSFIKTWRYLDVPMTITVKNNGAEGTKSYTIFQGEDYKNMTDPMAIDCYINPEGSFIINFTYDKNGTLTGVHFKQL